MSESQTLKTMLHETAHSMLHNKEINQDIDAPVKDRNTKEVEAESIAYTVCQHFGMGNYSDCFELPMKGINSISNTSDYVRMETKKINQLNSIANELTEIFKRSIQRKEI